MQGHIQRRGHSWSWLYEASVAVLTQPGQDCSTSTNSLRSFDPHQLTTVDEATAVHERSGGVPHCPPLQSRPGAALGLTSGSIMLVGDGSNGQHIPHASTYKIHTR
eukprot:200775-Chlamydomonas_euryale.AAC.1